MDQIKKTLFTLCFLWLPLFLFSQNKMMDNLFWLLQNAKDDSTKISLHYKLAKQLEGYDLTRADNHLEEGYKLAKGRNNTYQAAYYHQHKGELLFDMTRYSESQLHLDTAMLLYDGLINSAGQDATSLVTYQFGKTDCLISKGLLSAKLYKYQESIQFYLDAIGIMEHINGKDKNAYMANLHADIASDYYELEQFENALTYDQQSLPYLDQNDDIDQYVIGHLFVADDFSGLSKFDSSSLYLEKMRPIVMELDKPALNIRFYYILGGIYRKKKEWNHALHSFQKANAAAVKMQDHFQMLNTEEGLAACYLNLNDFTKARELAITVLNKSEALNIPLGKAQSLQLLIAIEERTGNIEQAYHYQKEWILVNDSMKKEKVERQMHETEVKYQNEKKEKDILQLQKNNTLQALSLQKKSTINYLLIGLVVVLLITAFLGYHHRRHRQQLAKQQEALQLQRIGELEKDRQLVAVDSMLKGQEKERGRMAKDLHDGLGGMLSSVKLTLEAMKGNTIISEDHTRLFAKALDQLDQSISEMRRVAHNMMPEALIKFGLQQAILDYCNNLREGTPLVINTQFYELENRLDGATEIIVYRIIQELLNNIVKHAYASEAFVQVMRHGRNLNITVEDNGKGFIYEDVESKKSAGLNNVRSRVDYLKGQIDIQSVAGKGTSILMDCIIEEQ